MASLTDREYDAELHKLHDQLLLMGAKVEEMINNSMRALEQVLANLIDNAIKYCPEGARITARGAIVGQKVEIAIEDTGPGIEERHLPRLFERFYRVDPGRSRDMGGTGLGLSIVKHVVEAMKGEVGVHSKFGLGTTFWVRLPRALEPPETDAASEPASDSPPSADPGS